MHRNKSLAYFRNIYKIASADGKLTQEEKQLLADIAQKMGITARESVNVMMNINNLDFVIPEKITERFKQLRDIVEMMIIDKDVHPKEYELCINYAEKIGYSKIIIDNLIEELSSKITN